MTGRAIKRGQSLCHLYSAVYSAARFARCLCLFSTGTAPFLFARLWRDPPLFAFAHCLCLFSTGTAPFLFARLWRDPPLFASLTACACLAGGDSAGLFKIG